MYEFALTVEQINSSLITETKPYISLMMLQVKNLVGVQVGGSPNFSCTHSCIHDLIRFDNMVTGQNSERKSRAFKASCGLYT